MFPSCVVALLLVAVIIKDVGVVSAAVWQGSSTGVEAVWGWCKNKRAKVLRLMSAEAEDFQSEMTSFFSPLISCTTFKPTTWTVTPARTQLLQKWRLSEFSCQRAGWPKISTIFLPFFHHQWRVGLSDVHPWHCWLLKQMENRPRIHSKNYQLISTYSQVLATPSKTALLFPPLSKTRKVHLKPSALSGCCKQRAKSAAANVTKTGGEVEDFQKDKARSICFPPLPLITCASLKARVQPELWLQLSENNRKASKSCQEFARQRSRDESSCEGVIRNAREQDL